jgi:ABC-type multidrug transport system fused ATPase/permease subunit
MKMRNLLFKFKLSKIANIISLKQTISLFSKSERSKISLVLVIQLFLNVLDLIGVAFIGFLGSLTFYGVASKQPGERTSKLLEFLNLNQMNLRSQIIVIGILASIFLFLKSIIGLYLNRKLLYFLSRSAARVSSTLLNLLLGSNILTVNKRSIQEIIWSLTHGVQIIFVGIVGTSLSILADIFLLILLFSGLFIADIFTTLIIIVIFVSIGLILNATMKNHYVHTQSNLSKVLVKTNEKTNEVILSFREIFVRGRQLFYADNISELRKKSADASAEIAFLQNISKYVMELVLVIGILIIISIQFSINTPGRAIAVISLFIASSTRIAPAILRIQQGFLTIRGNIAGAKLTFDLLSETKSGIRSLNLTSKSPDFKYENFIPSISAKNVDFIYPGASQFRISDLNLEIEPGTFFAIIGSSGSGKSTIVDLLLGILQPNSGEILISGMNPLEAVKTWPGAISYVPQDVFISNGTILENLVLGYNASDFTEQMIRECIETAQLTKVIQALEVGHRSEVGDRGSKLSGGQRQRVGIARALITKPKILVLDEATSSLDSETEFQLSNEIKKLRGTTTLIVIAHRLSTIKHADKIIFIDNGKILALGNFEELRKQLPEFETQIKKMHL